MPDKKIYYVEMRKTIYHTGEVEADSPEDAQNEMLLRAGGDPRDWVITQTDEVCHRATTEPEPGALTFG